MRRLLLLSLLSASTSAAAFAGEVDFAHDVAPLLKRRCAECHSGARREGGLSIDSRESLVAGGETGSPAIAAKSADSELIRRVASDDESTRMPPEGEPLSEKEIALLAKWIDEGAAWESGFTFAPPQYEPPLKPRRVELPPAREGRTNPVDRIVDAYLEEQGAPFPARLDDGAFLRRASLDLIGLLPTPEEFEAFANDRSPDKRDRLVRSLLARDMDYAEHWLRFWNDLLRNDYAGTGFITGGRTQISAWLYEALVTNKPYDRFVRELIAPPTPESAGFANGIRWRGEVSAGQTVEIQFAQNVGQAFLGINLKCASCHDSFIDRWKLKDAYGLAAVYSQRPLELHRCDKPTGETASPAWLFDELGQIDADAPQPERLQQLASLMTHRENGRFARTIVNRLWQQLMGRGIVHPTDAMQSEPWNEDLLDYLAWHLIEHDYDLKKTLELIATSEAYASQAESVAENADADGYAFAGPRSKRMTAEQFVDSLWQITGTAPAKFDAPIVRGPRDPNIAASPVQGTWIWNRSDTSDAAAGEAIALRRRFDLDRVPAQAFAVVSCDNAYSLYVNGARASSGENWEAPELVSLPALKVGTNEILIVAKNGGSGPNPAALFFEARWTDAEGQSRSLVSDGEWEWSSELPRPNGKYVRLPTDWKPAEALANQQIWVSRLQGEIATLLSNGNAGSRRMVRASLLKSDFLMRSLGRPNRDQIVSVRPTELTTLEALDLSAGNELAEVLRRGASNLRAREWKSPEEFLRWLYRFALSRDPSPEEFETLATAIGPDLSEAAIEDVLWAVAMLPEYQLVR